MFFHACTMICYMQGIRVSIWKQHVREFAMVVVYAAQVPLTNMSRSAACLNF